MTAVSKITANGTTNVLLLRPASTIQKVVPLGLLNLSAHLKKACPGVEVRLVDFRLHDEKPYGELPAFLGGFEPDIIGISCLSLELVEAVSLAEHCRRQFPNALLVLGGPAASSDFAVIEPLRLFDRIVVGEGEEIFRRIADRAITGANEVLHASDYPAVDINYVEMPDYSIINLADYFLRDNSHEAFQRFRKYVPIFTSRGCPFDCGFCFHLFGKKVRFRDMANVCKEVEYLVNVHGVREIHIEDDVFNLDKQRVGDFFAFLESRGLRLAVSFPNGIIYKNIDEQLVKTFKNGGVYRVSLGIESTSPRIMELISKHHDLEKLDSVIRLLEKHRILTHGFMITGFPTETEDDLDKSIEFVLNSRLHTFRFAHYVPFKGTRLYDEYPQMFENQGITDTLNLRYGAGQVYSDIPLDVTNEKIRALSLKFYLHPRRIFSIFVAMDKVVMTRFVLRKARLYLARAAALARPGGSLTTTSV